MVFGHGPPQSSTTFEKYDYNVSPELIQHARSVGWNISEDIDLQELMLDEDDHIMG